MRNRRYLTLTIAPLLALAACTAIAGLDGEYGVDLPDGATGGPETGSTTSTSGIVDGSPKPDGSSSGDVDASPDARVDTGIDARVPFDASTPPTLPFDGSVTQGWCGTTEANGPGRQFCWDFAGSNAITGWERVWPDSGAGMTFGTPDVPGNSGGTALRAVMNGTSGFPSTFVGYNSGLTASSQPANGTLTLTFTFRVEAAGVVTSVGGLVVNGTFYGLTVHPKACDGLDCLAENPLAGRPANLLVASAFDPQRWYRGSVRLTKGAPGWTGEIRVGGKLVSSQPAAAPATGNNQIIIAVGAFESPPNTAQSATWIDDVHLERSPP